MDPRPGDLFVVRTSGFVAWAIRLLTRSTVNHAGVYLAGNFIGEADPKGYRIVPNNRDALITIPMDLDDYQRDQIHDKAWAMVGTKYNFLDIAALAITLSLGSKTPRLVERRLSRRDRLMCSQACDQLMLDIGVHLFNDGRLPGEVTPGDLLLLYKP